MKRTNTLKRTNSLGARLLSLLLAACLVAGFGWTAAGTAYAGDVTGEVLTDDAGGENSENQENLASKDKETGENNEANQEDPENKDSKDKETGENNEENQESLENKDNGTGENNEANQENVENKGNGNSEENQENLANKDNGTGENNEEIKQDPQATGNGVPMAVDDDEDEKDVTVNFQAAKRLINRDMQDDEFRFQLAISEEAEGAPATIVGTSSAATAGSFSNVIFKAATFTKAGTYTYTMSEVKGVDALTIYDETTYTAVVTVTEDAATGDLSATVAYTDKDGGTVETPSFTNVAQYVTADLPCTKTLIGRAMAENEFAFGLSLESYTYNNLPTKKAIDLDTGDSYVAIATVGAGADGEKVNFAFDKVKFTEVGTYVFDVEELYCFDPTIRYDTHTGTITVTVELVDHKLAVTGIQSVDTDFVNMAGASATIQASKTMAGKDMTEGEFGFTVTPAKSYTNVVAVTDSLQQRIEMNAKKQRNVIHETTAAIGRNSASELTSTLSTTSAAYEGTTAGNPAAKQDTKTVFNLETLTFTKPGTYYFAIREDQGNEEGVRYDSNIWTATVTVSSGQSGMTASVTYTDSQGNTADQADFTNQAGLAEITLTGTKVLKNSSINGNFFFGLTYLGSNNLPTTKANTGDEIAPDYMDIVTCDSAAEGQAASFSFKPLYFDKAGTYYYSISEIPYESSSVCFDEHSCKVTVTVAEDADGKLTATAAYSDGDHAQFVNYIGAKFTMNATKTLYGRDLQAKEFSFTVTPKGFTIGDSSGVYSEGASNDATLVGKGQHLELRNAAEEFASGKLSAYSWANTYTVTGRDSETVQCAGGADGTNVPFSLGTYYFTKPGDYTFEAREVIPTDTGDIIYDTSVWEITVHVEKTSVGLVAYADYLDTEINQTETWAVFENFYKCPQVTITGTKTLLGRNMRDNEFSFALKLISEPVRYNNLPTTKAIDLDDDLDDAMGIAMDDAMAIDMNDELDDFTVKTEAPTLQQVSVGAGDAGKPVAFSFAPITFSRAGEYIFEVQEIPGSAANVTYDTHVATIIIEVGKDADGNLTITNLTADDTDFVNSYEAPYTPFTPVKPTEPEETKKPTEPDVPTTVDDHSEDDKPQEPTVTEGPTQPEEPTVTEGPTQPEGPTVTEGPGDALEDQNEGTGLEKPQETAPETSVKPSVAPGTSAKTASTSLPQTGQDWWPVLLLVAVGVLLIAAGVFHGKKHNI